ncbi:uncharacterized protein BDR25DRAFT_350733 [Lindgomyces ingoldianus]|uniref:Uncharacterized protein n=1 Tax=Lindgomyces ingoldianus TaxID=673940 RepID=A0ACB6R9Z8_9PLEO|nr:uncharacterized protein BDR25DRAFT_350733 [Lindgomyces ingoldianus]KAF2475347.1 hypothetical protein BDR25DRAFT_350733 [Lindgomyces ingoldianus]
MYSALSWLFNYFYVAELPWPFSERPRSFSFSSSTCDMTKEYEFANHYHLPSTLHFIRRNRGRASPSPKYITSSEFAISPIIIILTIPQSTRTNQRHRLITRTLPTEVSKQVGVEVVSTEEELSIVTNKILVVSLARLLATPLTIPKHGDSSSTKSKDNTKSPEQPKGMASKEY